MGVDEVEDGPSVTLGVGIDDGVGHETAGVFELGRRGQGVWIATGTDRQPLVSFDGHRRRVGRPRSAGRKMRVGTVGSVIDG